MASTTFRIVRSSAISGLLGAALLTLPGAAAQAEPQTFEFDKDHTEIRVSWNHLGLSEQSAVFEDFSGNLTFDRENVANSSVEVAIQPESIESGVEDFNEHLKSSDFFHVEEHGEVTFKSTSVVQTGPDTGRMTGDLTIKGITKPVTLEVQLNYAGEHPLAPFSQKYKGREAAGFSATGRVLRSEFDLGRNAPIVSDWVDITINTELYRNVES